MNNKRLFKSVLGIPNWIIVALLIFIIVNTLYEGLALLISTMWILIISSVLLLFALLSNFTKISTIKRIASNSLGR